MGAWAIDTPSTAPHYTIDVQIEGQTYRLELRWNVRDSSWYMGILAPDDSHLAAPKRIASGRPLFWRSQSPALPPGLFVPIDSAGGDVDPGLQDLGNRVVLLYFDSTELVA